MKFNKYGIAKVLKTELFIPGVTMGLISSYDISVTIGGTKFEF